MWQMWGLAESKQPEEWQQWMLRVSEDTPPAHYALTPAAAAGIAAPNSLAQTAQLGDTELLDIGDAPLE